jgi:hypothetical protein
MKHCPSCNRTYTDEALNFCLEDGTPLVTNTAATQDNETIRYDAPRGTNPPPVVYNPPQQPYQAQPVVNRAPAFQGQWSPMGVPQARKSNAVWWVLGGLAVVVVLGIGIVVVLLAVASMSSQSNTNRITVSNNSNRNSNANRTTNNSNSSRDNTNSGANLPASFTDDFSTPKWGVGSSQFGDLSYLNDEYHMKSKEKVFLLIYGPSNDYNTENATIRVTTRSVDGISPTTGYGLVAHGERTKDDKLEDYSFLIDSSDTSRYKIVLHKNGVETILVPWTPSTTIRHGTSTNQLEVRIKGSLLSFYINGQYANSITDTANFKRGRAGLYTSDAHEVAFDDLQITR